MSTRSNVKIQTPNGTLWLYKHCDGYPSGTGKDVAELALRIMDPMRNNSGYAKRLTEIANSLLRKLYDASAHREARPMYELTEDVHGDIEHCYCIKVTNAKAVESRAWYDAPNVSVGHAAGYGPELAEKMEWYAPPAFAEKVVNAAIREDNKHYANLRKDRPDEYGDLEDEALVEVPDAKATCKH